MQRKSAFYLLAIYITEAIHRIGIAWNAIDFWKPLSPLAWLFTCMYAIIMAWLTEQPTNDRINRNLRPFESINLYVVNVASSWTMAIKIDAIPVGMCVPDLAIIVDPYVRKMICAVKMLSSEKIIACKMPCRDFTETTQKKHKWVRWKGDFYLEREKK